MEMEMMVGKREMEIQETQTGIMEILAEKERKRSRIEFCEAERVK